MKINPRLVGLIIVVFFTVLVSGIIFFNVILPGDSFHWDEAHHGIYGVWLARDIGAGNWDSFWYDTHRQTLWPFFHSWLLSAFFLIFGVSFQSARFLSLVLFFISAVIVYLVSEKVSKKSGWKIGLLASFLFITSPLMLSFSAQNMLEGVGALLFILAFYVYLVSEEKNKWYFYIMFGSLLGTSIVTKYNYAYLILTSFTGVIFFDLFELYKNPKKHVLDKSPKDKKAKKPPKIKVAPIKQQFYSWIYKNILVAIPVFIVFFSWFFSGDSSRKFQMLLWSKKMVAEQQGILPGFWKNILFYPKVLMQDYAFSPWLGLLMVLSILLPFTINRFKHINKLYIIVWVSLFLSIFTIGNKMNRLIYIIVPFVYIIFAASVYYFIEVLTEKSNYRRIEGIFLLILFLPACFSIMRIPKMLGGDISDVGHGLYVDRKKENMVDVLNFFRNNISSDKSISTAISMGAMSPYAFYCYFHDWEAPVFTRFQANDRRFYQSEYYLTVDLEENSTYFAGILDDSVNSWNEFLSENVGKGKLELFKQEKFDTIGVTAKIYQITRVMKGPRR